MPAARPVCGVAMQAATAVKSPAQPTLQPHWSFQQPQMASMLSRGFAKGAAKAKRGACWASHCTRTNSTVAAANHACSSVSCTAQAPDQMHACTCLSRHMLAAEKNRQAAPERTRQEPHKRHAPATPEGSLVDFTEEEL